ncbi:GGDEF domain-containing protein [Nocardioides sambongensis]|uniref:GGDEF domain-containing protein n=1 Tax=Nocardioides sambongensis TaxID=2589074 RepID=UPI00112C6E59|nr:GGDEF domain-containing protein [Nocardioides sambongensis]
MTAGAAHVVPDTRADEDYSCQPVSEVVRAYVGFPIGDEQGGLFGVLCGADLDPLESSAAVDAELIALLSGLLSSHLAVARAADRVRHDEEVAAALADTDALTGLVNRRGWDKLVADAQQRVDAYGDPVAVAVIDLDGLKQVNDADGHTAGDDLLRRTGAALRSAASDHDRVARYGGDEFTVLTDDVGVGDLPAHYARFADRLRADGIAASLGHAFAGPGDRTVHEAFRLADAEMYVDKRARHAR